MILHAGEQHIEWASWWRDVTYRHRVRIEVCRNQSGAWTHVFRITCCSEIINLRVEHAEAYRRALEMMRDHILGSSPGISLLEWASQG